MVRGDVHREPDGHTCDTSSGGLPISALKRKGGDKARGVFKSIGFGIRCLDVNSCSWLSDLASLPNLPVLQIHHLQNEDHGEE